MKRFAATLPLLLALIFTLSPAQAGDFSNRPEVDAFIADMQARHDIKAQELKRLFAHAERLETVLVAILPPTTPQQKSWQDYRSRFVNDKRIREGVAFWKRHATTLSRASQQYGVPEEIIVAIIGVETEYGKTMGRYRVFEALATLAFDYPPRADFFRSELENFLLLTREAGDPPLAVRGSYAGAIGIPQFMPSSWRRYAVDYDGDGRIDLRNSPTDAIGSVANFLKEHGWEANQPVTTAVEIATEKAAPLIAAGIKPSFPAKETASHGILAQTAIERPWALIDLPTPDEATEYWLGFQNFFVLTRYNRSNLYAMSVFQLAQEIAEERKERLAKR